MSPIQTPNTDTSKAMPNLPERAVKALATSIFKHLRHEGCQPKDIISVSTQLLSLVTTELTKDHTPNT